MSEALRRLSDEDLRQLSAAVRSGRLSPPFTAVGLDRFVLRERATGAASEMQKLFEEGLKPEHLAMMLELLSAGRSQRQQVVDAIEIVSTGPEGPEAANRDTSVVVRDLFLGARESVLVAGYAVYQGRQVFRALAERMEGLPNLKVRMFLDVQRSPGDSSEASEILRRFAERFRTREWPGTRRPEIYYDPRSLEMEVAKRSSLHAKCVVVDHECAFVSSANFTEAAQVRNIEVGVLVRSEAFARKLAHHFEALAASGFLERLPGL